MIPVIPAAALSEGEMVTCRVGAEEVLVTCVDGHYFAVSNFCPHAGQRLSGGRLDGYRLHCPLHRAVFDIRSGAILSGPATEPLRRFPVIVERGKLCVETAGR